MQYQCGPVLRSHLWRAKSAGAKDRFHTALLGEAADVAATIPGVQHFSVNAVYDASHRLKIAPGPFLVDAISHLTFADAADRERAERSLEYRQFGALMAPFLESSLALDVTQRIFVKPASIRDPDGSRHRLLKRMSILQRAASLSAEAFQKTWKNEHGPRVASHEGHLLGYLQDAVDTCKVEHGEIRSSCDGLTELWFEDHDGMEKVLPEKAASSVTGNAARIIASISTFLVRETHLF